MPKRKREQATIADEALLLIQGHDISISANDEIALKAFIVKQSQTLKLKELPPNPVSFLCDCLTGYYDIKKEIILRRLTRKKRPRRETANYSVSLKKIKSNQRDNSNLLAMVARHPSKPSRFFVQATTGETLTPERTRTLTARGVSLLVEGADDLTSPGGSRYSSNTPEKTLKGPNGTPYGRALSTSSLTLFRTQSPSHYALRSPQNFSHPALPHQKKEIFSFTVTKETLNANKGKKRRPSQKAAMGGHSAYDIFTDMGMTSESSDSRHYHLAHRQGHSFGGAQDHTNLDPATAGSNYNTLFYIEDPIKELILKDKFTEVRVEGKVTYRANTSLAEKVTYTWFWGNGCFAKKTIDLHDPKVPTVAENKMVKLVLRSTRTPESKKNETASGASSASSSRKKLSFSEDESSPAP